MKMVMEQGSVPAGSYWVTFVGLDEAEDSHGYGPGLRLRFRVAAGEHAGKEVTRVCAAKLTPMSTLGKLVAAINGRAIAVGVEVDFDRLIGRHGLAVVETVPSGIGTRVVSFVRHPGPGGAPAPAPARAPRTPETTPTPAAVSDDDGVGGIDDDGCPVPF